MEEIRDQLIEIRQGQKNHEAADIARFSEVYEKMSLNHDEIMDTLKPIVTAFTAVNLLGSWGRVLLGVVAIILGIVVSLITIFSNKT